MASSAICLHKNVLLFTSSHRQLGFFTGRTGLTQLLFFWSILNWIALRAAALYLNFLHISCVAGSLLNATFGNATELVISVHALRSGKLRVVQQSLLGSILSNTLLVLGCAFFGGGLACGKTEQAFRKVSSLSGFSISWYRWTALILYCWQEDAVLNSGLLLMAVMGLVSPAMLYYTHTEVNLGQSALALSRFSSCIMLVAYAAFVYFELSNSCRRDEACQVSLMSPFYSAHYLFIPLQVSEVLLCAFYQGGSGDQGDDDYDYAYPEISKWEAIAWLAIFTAWISVFSGYLVDAIEVLYLSNLTSDVSWSLPLFAIILANTFIFYHGGLWVSAASCLQGASKAWKIPIAFISTVLLPIVGNAAEHASAVMFAMKDKLVSISLTLLTVFSNFSLAMLCKVLVCIFIGHFPWSGYWVFDADIHVCGGLFSCVMLTIINLNLDWLFHNSC